MKGFFAHYRSIFLWGRFRWAAAHGKSMDDTFIKTEPHVTRKIAPAERIPKAYPGTIYFVWKHTRVTY